MDEIVHPHLRAEVLRDSQAEVPPEREMTEVSAVEVATTSNTKPSNGETLITLVLDETGSMSDCYDSTISSVNDYLGSQKVADGVANVNLYKFSDVSGYGYSRHNAGFGGIARTAQAAVGVHVEPEKIRAVFENTAVANIPALTRETYKPLGGTNLYDAIGSTIRRVESQLDGMDAVPAVLIVIVTDGGENCSREFSLATVKKMVGEKEAQGWTFVYLGANQDAWEVGQSFGLAKGQTMSYSTANMESTMSTLAGATSVYRSMRSSGARAFNAVDKDFFAASVDSDDTTSK